MCVHLIHIHLDKLLHLKHIYLALVQTHVDVNHRDTSEYRMHTCMLATNVYTNSNTIFAAVCKQLCLESLFSFFLYLFLVLFCCLIIIIIH